MKTQVRVISLETALERRAAFDRHSRECGVSWDYYNAHTELCADLEYEESRLFVHYIRSLIASEKGCYSSHYAVWKAFLSSEDEQLLVMEDDALVDWALIRQIVEKDFSRDGMDYIRLASIAMPPSVNKGQYLGRYVYQLAGYALGTCAYLITRKAAAALVSYCRVIRGPIDLVMDQSWWSGIPCFALFPYSVVERAGVSTIGQSRNAKLFTMSEWPAHLRAKKFIFRVKDALRRRAYASKVMAGLGPRVKADARWL